MLEYEDLVFRTKTNFEEAQVLFDYKCNLSKKVGDLNIDLGDGYYSTKHDKFIKGKPPVGDNCIRAIPGFRKKHYLSIKYFMKAMPTGNNGFKIFGYCLNYNFEEKEASWIPIHVLDYNANHGSLDHSADNGNIVIDVNVNDGPFSFCAEINGFLNQVSEALVEIEMDLSAIVESDDGFSNNLFVRLVYDVFKLIDGERSMENIRDRFATIVCDKDTFRDKWTPLFQYITLSKSFRHLEVSEIIKEGFIDLLSSVFDGQNAYMASYRLNEIKEREYIRGLPKNIKEKMREYKWGHNIITMSLLKRISDRCEDKDIIDMLTVIDQLSINDKEKSNRFLSDGNKALRKAKSTTLRKDAKQKLLSN